MREWGDEAVSRFATRKAGALLAYLAFYRNRPHPREAIIDMLWPESDPEDGQASLSVALSSLRRQPKRQTARRAM